MATIKHHKVVAVLPSPLESDSVYYVRMGSGIAIYVTNGIGAVVAYSLNPIGGTAAAADAQANKNDATDGRLQLVGAFGGPDNTDYRHFTADLTAPGGIDWDTITGKGLYKHLVLGSEAHGPGGNTYFYVLNYRYGGVANPTLTQFAIPYNTMGFYVRTCYDGVWLPWVRKLTTADLTVSPSDATIGRITKTGDAGMLTNALLTSNPVTSLNNINLSSGWYGFGGGATGAPNGLPGLLEVQPLNGAAVRQIVRSVNGSSDVTLTYERQLRAGPVYGDWVLVYNSANQLALGTTPASARSALVLDHPTLRQYGAVNDGITNADAALAAAFAAAKQFNIPSGDYLVTGVNNPMGIQGVGDGRLMKAVTGGKQQLNSDVDLHQHVYGQEYLYAFHTKLMAAIQGSKVVCSGDSTTSGLYPGLDEPFYIHQLVQSAGADHGFQVTTVNSGKFGKNTADWLSTYITEDMAQNPDLYIVRWGLNDPLVSGRTLANFAADLRQGLANIRASKTVGQMSILLMTPNSTADSAAGRDEAWHEKVRLIYRQAARDYKCAFIDTYALWRDSRISAGLWMDDIGGGIALHPKSVMNIWICSKIAELIYPKAYPNRVSTRVMTANDPPSQYPLGYSIRLNDATFGATGMVVTFRGANGACFQIASSVFDAPGLNNNYPVAQVAMRSGCYLVLGPIVDRWHTTWSTQPAADIGLLNGWVALNAASTPKAQKSNNVVTLSGGIRSGTVTSGTVIGQIPAGFRPRSTEEHFLVPTNTTAVATACRISINQSGQIIVIAGASANAIYFSGVSFESGG